jgi:hypothetical protein
MVMVFGGPGIVPSSRGVPSSVISLPGGAAQLIPAGSWMIDPGLYCGIERFDPVTGMWRKIGSMGQGEQFIASDGVNQRMCNRTGCAVGALLTNAGSGYTSAPVITPSAGASVWVAVMGALVSTTVTVSTGGSNYVYPPICIIGSPSNPGIQATATAAISGGAVSAITIVNQGGGYITTPTITLLNDPRDTTGNGATAVLSLTGQGTINGVICTDHGNPLTAVPTLTFTGGGGSSAAATAIMDFALTGYTVGTAGAVIAAPAQTWGVPAPVSGSAAYTNPFTQVGLVNMRQGSIIAAVSGSAITATGLVVLDGGHYETVPTMQVIQSGIATTWPILTAAVGAQTGTFIQQAC